MTDAKLRGVHPMLVEKVRRILGVMESLGYPMMVAAGVRTEAEQAALFAQGRSAPGHIVTNADGVSRRSNHQRKTDGYGYAVDCCFVVNGVPSWGDRLPWRLYGEIAKALGLKWGGDWSGLVDRPHIELPETLGGHT